MANKLDKLIKTATEQYSKAVKPVVQGLEAQRSPLQSRYDELLNSIKGQQQTAEQRQTVTTQNELGKRGILPSSGLAQQELTSAINPITSQFSGLIANTGIERENALNQINQLIAQTKSGAATGGLSTAYDLYNKNQANKATQQQTALQQQQQAFQNALDLRKFQEVTLPSTKYELGKPYYKPEGVGFDLTTEFEAFKKQLGGK